MAGQLAVSAPFWEQPLQRLDKAQWEALCDGCGRCCLHKLEDEDTGRVYYTRVACRLLDVNTGRCRDYARRQQLEPDCTVLDDEKLARFDWLPSTCAYRLRAAGRPLPAWHPLRSGRPQSVREAGVSVVGWALAEDEVGLDALEDHLIDAL